MQQGSTIRTIARPAPGTWRRPDSEWTRFDVELRRQAVAAEEICKEVRRYAMTPDRYILDRSLLVLRRAAKATDPGTRRTIGKEALEAHKRLRLVGAEIRAAALNAPHPAFLRATAAIACAIKAVELADRACAAADEDERSMRAARQLAYRAGQAYTEGRAMIDDPAFVAELTEALAIEARIEGEAA